MSSESELPAQSADCQGRFEKAQNCSGEDDEASKFLSCDTRVVIVKPQPMNRCRSQQPASVRVERASCLESGTDSPRQRGRLTQEKCSFYTIDCLIAATIVGPMVVAHWRGIWLLMDYHENIFTGWACFGVGVSLHMLFAVLRQPLHDALAGSGGSAASRGCCGRLGLRLGRTVYIYLFSVACNCHWRGIWNILNDYIADEARVLVGCFTCAVLGDLALLRCLRNLLAPPFLVSLDSAQFVFRFPTRYRLSTRDWSLYVLDCAFSVGVVGTLVVFVWRGAWALLDLYLFPDSRESSAIGSLVIGYALVALAFSAQPLVRLGCARLQGLRRLALADAFLLLSFLGTVNVWRGIWNALDLYLLPQLPQTSCWISHLGCFALLVLLNCSNSILVRGVYIDGEEQGGKCVVFPCHYLRLLFKEERQGKEARRASLLQPAAALASENGALLNGSDSQGPREPESLV